MQNRTRGALVFAVHLCFAIIAVLLLTARLAATEVYLTNGHTLADAEIANDCATHDASTASATYK